MVGRSFMKDEQRAAILEELPMNGDVLELGTGHGVTVAWWAQRRPQVRFCSIDNFKAAEGTGPGDIEHWLLNHRQNQVLFVGTSVGFCRYSDTWFDVAFVDAGHSHDDCWQDLCCIEPTIKAGGKILVHDYDRMDVPKLRGVTRAVDEFCAEHNWQVKRVVFCTAVLERT